MKVEISFPDGENCNFFEGEKMDTLDAVIYYLVDLNLQDTASIHVYGEGVFNYEQFVSYRESLYDEYCE